MDDDQKEALIFATSKIDGPSKVGLLKSLSFAQLTLWTSRLSYFIPLKARLILCTILKKIFAVLRSSGCSGLRFFSLRKYFKFWLDFWV